MDPLSIAFILMVLFPLGYVLMRDYMKGLCLAMLFLVVMPEALVVRTPGALPNFTIHRLIVVLLILVWLARSRDKREILDAPFFWPIIVVAAVNFLSLLAAEDLVAGLKRYLSLTIDIFLFYFIAAVTIRKESDVLRLMRYLVLGLAIVAVIAVVEKYTRFNPVDAYVPGYQRLARHNTTVMSTYPHRILLGTAMAMGWPIAFVLIGRVKKAGAAYYSLWLSIILLLAACYFAMSRGPWLGAIIAGLVLFLLGSLRVKKQAAMLMGLMLLGLFLFPGVLHMLSTRARQTFDESQKKGQTYAYRWELWKIAYFKISTSPTRMILGYGQGYHESEAALTTWNLPRAEDFQVWSWDNHYAALLLETGFLGLGAMLFLYAAMIKRLWDIWRMSDDDQADIIGGIAASVIVLMFMMTNVFIFSSQLNYLFWGLIAAGLAFEKETEEDVDDDDEEEHEDADTDLISEPQH